MSIQLFDPVGEIEVVQRQPARALASLKGKRVGCVFNQHVSAIAFWKAMEAEIEKTLAPSRTLRVYKSNTWAPAPRAEANRVIEETDYVLVGVGA
ncbi:MAG: UGSC family (seleno)protein [Burkholderiales bacterium]